MPETADILERLMKTTNEVGGATIVLVDCLHHPIKIILTNSIGLKDPSDQMPTTIGSKLQIAAALLRYLGYISLSEDCSSGGREHRRRAILLPLSHLRYVT